MRGGDAQTPGNPEAAALRSKLARTLDQPVAGRPPPPQIPDHTLLRCVGEGACGEVWLARSALGTLRAVKVVYRARFKHGRPYEREFDGIVKYEPISRTHEGLVQVLHVGRSDDAGCFYYVMELADPVETREIERPVNSGGSSPQTPALDPATYRPRTLRSELTCRDRLPPTEAAQLVLRLTRALAHLHDCGLVHRDIKPSNVIFVSGQPKLADIGLVTDVGSSHSFVGTEGFIPPEGPGTPQADLYGLGKLLYELVAGRDRLEFPQLPAQIKQLPDCEAILELNEIMTRACAPDVRQRYATATQFQAELNLFLAGRSLRWTRTVERGLARLKQLAAAACLLLALTAAALWFSKREEWHALERARHEAILRERAEVAERRTEQQLYTALLEQARATVRSGDLGQRMRALDAVRQAAAISNSVELRREVLAALTLPDLQFGRELSADAQFTLRRLDPNFDRIALGRGRGPVEIRSVSDDRLVASLPASTNLMTYDAIWSEDGRFLAVKRIHDAMGYHNDLEVWAVDEPRQILLVRGVRSLARSFHPHKPQLLTGDMDGTVVLWDLEQGKSLSRSTLEVPPEYLLHSPKGDRLAVSYRCPKGWGISIHNAADGARAMSHEVPHLISALAWHPEGRWIAFTDHGGFAHLLDSTTGVLSTLGQHKAEAASAVFSPDGRYLLTGGWERELICWDLRTQQRALTIGLDSYVAQFRADGRACALSTRTGVQLHAFELPAAHRYFEEPLGPRFRHAAFSPDGRWVAGAGDGHVGVWDLTRTAPGIIAEAGAETQLFWTPDGHELFGSSRHQDCFRWQVHASADPAAPPVLQAVPMPRPSGFVSLQLASNQIVWTSSRGALISGPDGLKADDPPWSPSVHGISGTSPDGRWLAICRTYSPVLHIYQLPELTLVAQLTNRANIEGFSFSPTVDELGVASRDNLQFWSTANWVQTRAATNFIGIPDIGMLFEPGGRTLWLAKAYRTAGLYSLRTLEPIFFLPSGMFPLALSADGRHLAVSLDAQRLLVWDLKALREQFRDLGLDWTD
jgi:hypothetical protein